MITAERLREVLQYEPDTGVFRWRVALAARTHIGDIAGSPGGKRYLLIGIDGRVYSAHRLAWLHTHGVWPKHQIDHINGDRTDNRLSNLREATNAQNNQNRRKRSGCSSRFVGVNWSRDKRCWQARIYAEGRGKHLGYFDSEEAAFGAYCAAKRRVHTFNPLPPSEVNYANGL